MTFRKNNEYRAEPIGEKALDPRPVCFKIDTELKDRLKSIPGWQQKLRDALPDLISRWSESGETSDTNNLD